jgi:hypothetical protein
MRPISRLIKRAAKGIGIILMYAREIVRMLIRNLSANGSKAVPSIDL